MATTLFYFFSVVFADAASSQADEARGARVDEHHNGVYLIEEQAPNSWKVWENGHPVAMTLPQHDELARLLQALRPLPDPAIEAPPVGCDGTWCTLDVRSGGARQSYRWWAEPPPAWARLGAVVDQVRKLAQAPRLAMAGRNRVVVEQFFDRLAARDVEGAMGCCSSQIRYSNPFFEDQFERHGAQAVASMWRAWLQMLPDARIACDDIRAGHENASAYWSADLVLANGQPVRQQISADLSLAEGKITQHRDRFNLHEWASRMYGGPGSVLGRQAAFHRWMKARERARLAAFEKLSPD